MRNSSMGDDSFHEVAHAVLGILGNIASGLFFLSSAPMIVKIVRSKSSGGLSGDLYVFKLFNCMLWCLYGLPFVHPHDVWVVLTNSIGCAFALIYILAYLIYATSKEKATLLWKLLVVVSSFAIMVLLVMLLCKSQHQRILVVGTLSAIVSSGMHISLLSQCKRALQLKERTFLHPGASSAGFIKGAIWSAYGLESFDIFILIPNGVGVLIGIIEMILMIFILRSGGENLSSSHECQHKIHEEEKTSIEIKIQSDNKGLVEENSQSSRRRSLSFQNVSRASSLLGLPRQSSNVIVPIALDSP